MQCNLCFNILQFFVLIVWMLTNYRTNKVFEFPHTIIASYMCRVWEWPLAMQEDRLGIRSSNMMAGKPAAIMSTTSTIWISQVDPTVCGGTNRSNFRRDGTPAVDLLTMRQMKMDGEDVLRGEQPNICHRTTVSPAVTSCKALDSYTHQFWHLMCVCTGG